jgi:hypothetical protein
VKLAAALAILAAAGAITLGVVSIISSHDTSPDEIEACVEDAGGNVILGQEGLAFARTDIERGSLRRTREYRLGDDRGVLMEGDGYRVLVVGIAGGPSLAGPACPCGCTPTPRASRRWPRSATRCAGSSTAARDASSTE